MGPGLAAWFSWTCLLLISSAATFPLQNMYQRPLYKMTGRHSPLPKDQRPSLRSVQQKYLPQFPGSQSSPSAETPSVASTEYAKKGLSAPESGSSWPVYDPTSSHKSHAVEQVSTAIAPPAANPSGHLHQSWAVYGPVEEPHFSHKPSTGKVDTVKGQQTLNPGVDMPPNWALYNPVYEPSSESLTSPEVFSGGVEESSLETGNEESAFNPGGNWHHVWEAFNPFNAQPSGYTSTGIKGQQVANPDELSQNSKYEPPPKFESNTPEVPPGPGEGEPAANTGIDWHLSGYVPSTGDVKGELPASPEGNIPSWEMNPLPSNFETSTVPELPPGKGNWQHSSYKPSTGGVKGQSAANLPGNMPPNWASYSSVYEPTAPEAVPGGVKGSLRKGQHPAIPGDNLNHGWEAYHSAYEPPFSYESPTAPGNLPQSWESYSQEYEPSDPVKGKPHGTAKGQQTKLGGNQQQHWAGYSPVNMQGSSYKPSHGGVKGQQAVDPVGVFHNWESHSSIGHPSYESPVPSPGVQEGPSGTGQLASKTNGPSWVKVKHPGKGQSGNWHKGHIQASKVPSHPVKLPPGKGQSTAIPNGGLHTNLASSSSVYDKSQKYTPQIAPVHIQEHFQVNQPAGTDETAASEPGVNMAHGWTKMDPATSQGGNWHKGHIQASKVPSHPVKLPPGKGQSTAIPDGALHTNWESSSSVYDKSQKYTPPIAPVYIQEHQPAGIDENAASQPGVNMAHSWTKMDPATSQSGNWHQMQAHKIPPPPGTKIGTGKEQSGANPVDEMFPNLATIGLFNPFPSYEPSGGIETGSGQPGANPSYKWPPVSSPTNNKHPTWSGIHIRHPHVNGQHANPSGNLHTNWAEYSSVAENPPSYTAPVVPQGHLQVSLPSGSEANAASEPSSHWQKVHMQAHKGQTPSNPGDKLHPHRVGSSVYDRSQSHIPSIAPINTQQHLKVNLPATTGKGGPPALPSTHVNPTNPYWNSHQWSSTHQDHTGKGANPFYDRPSAPWVSNPEDDDDDDDNEDPDDENDDGIKMYIVQNRNGYQNERSEFSRMRYFQQYIPLIPPPGVLRKTSPKA
ncbi:uncharacterized protein LOC130909180 [Corythoichthys intestinalis]|uniref:uncharacterized protein LOC130909180 n=1 Tax=Corythoichthys intestinalis TaxID=161448 RepID=UPI0025A64E36|nr:uncharacterized protein LOC130909180 [Corythoichthys intestinalis]